MTYTPHLGPDQSDVDAVRELLDLMADFSSNDQRARYLLTCNWMLERGHAAAERLRFDDHMQEVAARTRANGLES